MGPSDTPPLVQSGGAHVLILTSDPAGPLAHPAGMTFDQLVEAYDSVAEADTVVIGLPIQGLPATSPITMGHGVVDIDHDMRTASFAGGAEFNGVNVVFALIGAWDGAGARPEFALLIRVDSTSLGAIVPGVAGTLLDDLAFPGAAVILSETEWLLPDSMPDVVGLLAPGLEAIEAGASFLGSFEPPPSLARALELIPSLDGELPSLEGGFGLDAAAVLADPGSAIQLEGLELDGALPVPAGPIGSLRVVAHTLSARWLEGGVVLTLDSDVTLDLDDAPRPFGFLTTVDTRAGGAASLTGRLTELWPDPFGLEWLTADSVVLHVAGSADERQLSVMASATALDEFTATLTVDTDVPELRLRLDADLDAAGLVRLVNGATGLTGADRITLPEGGPTLRQVDVTLRPEDDTPLVVTGGGTLLGDVDASALLTLIRANGRYHPLFSFHIGNGLIGALVPPLAGSVLDDAVPGGTLIVPVPDALDLSVERDSLPAAAREYFDAAWEGLTDYDVEVSSVLQLDAPIELSAVPDGVATVLGLDRAGHALLGGSVGVTLAVLAGTPDLGLDSLSIHATIPFAGSPTGMPDWLQPRSHALSYRWQASPAPTGSRQFTMDSHLVALLGSESVDLSLQADLEQDDESGSVSLHGRAGRWERPWDLHWLTVDSLTLTIEGDPEDASVHLGAELDVAGVPTSLGISATDDGDPELRIGVEPQLTLPDVGRLAGSLGGVDAEVTVTLPAGGPSLHGITAMVRPGAAAPFSLMGTGALRNGTIEVFALLTLVDGGQSGIAPVLVLRSGATTLGAIAPALDGSALDLDLPAMAITVPATVLDGLLTVPSSDLPVEVRDSLAAIFDNAPDFDLRIESALRLDAPVPLGFVPAPVGDALALDLDGSAHIGGSIGLHLEGLTTGDAAVDSVTLFAVVPRHGTPSFRPGWPEWLEPQRDSVALYWRRAPAASRLTLRSLMHADLDGATLPFSFETDIATDDGGDRVDLRGRTGRWEEPFGIDWFSVDSLGLHLMTSPDSSRAELGSAVEILDRDAALDIAVDSDGTAELQLTLGGIGTGDVRTLLANQWPQLELPGSFPEVDITDAFLYLRTGDVTGFSIGGNAHFYGQDASTLVSVSLGGSGNVVLAGFGVHDFSLATLLQDAGVAMNEDADHFMEVFTFDEAAIMFSTRTVDVADSELDRHAQQFFRTAFGDGSFDIPLRSGITAVARRELPPGGPLESAVNTLSRSNPDRSITVSGRIPGRYMNLADDPSSRLEFLLSLPEMAPGDSSAWFRSGRLSVELLGPPGISIGLVGDIGVIVDEHDLDFSVAAKLSTAGGGTLIFQGSMDAEREWVDPFDTKGLTLRRLGLDLTLNAVKAGMCVGGDMSIGSQDIRGAMGLDISVATGVPLGGVFFAGSDRGLVLADLVEMQAAMFDNPLLPISALPDMRLDTLEVLVAVPRSPDVLGLSCVPEGVSGNFAVRGNLWAQIEPTGGMDRLAHVDFRLGRHGIEADGELATGAIGPISWTDPKVDIAITRTDQHLLVKGGATIGEVLEVDSLELNISRDSLAFSTSMVLAGGFHAEIFAAASPSLVSPDFHVHGQVDGAFVRQLSADLYRNLGQYSDRGHVLLAEVRSNGSGVDLAHAVELATATAELAEHSLDAAEQTLRDLRAARAACSWQICTARYNASIAVWERIRSVRLRRYENARLALTMLLNAEAMAESLEAALDQLDDWLDNQKIVLSGAGFHTDLDQLLSGAGLEVHVDGSVDGVPLHVSVDLNAGLAHNVAAIIHDVLPAELGALLHQ